MPVASFLDTDLYKLTMQACVHKHYADADVEYLLYNRSQAMHLSEEAVQWIKNQVNSWKDLQITQSELEFLKTQLPYLPDEYFNFLSTFKLNPQEEVEIDFKGQGDLVIRVSGKWDRTIWYEVPILATVSEAYFKFIDTDWSMDGQYELAKSKARKLIEAKCSFSEFGTRRRRSFDVQRLVVEAIVEESKSAPQFLGTSNVHLAHVYSLKPSGTVAHELMMGIAAYYDDYRSANLRAMESWIDTVGPENAGVALTDTFGTSLFLQDFKKPFIDYYAGVRQDSGDPEDFTKLISKFYAKNGVPENTKKIIYSDSLNIERCIHLRDVALRNHLVPGFGVGTFFTNDFYHTKNPSEKSQPMNIVMKISKVNGRSAVKLSDNLGKNTGDPKEVARAKALLGYQDLTSEINEAYRWA